MTKRQATLKLAEYMADQLLNQFENGTLDENSDDLEMLIKFLSKKFLKPYDKYGYLRKDK